jgi:hypothetical protein
MKIVADIVLQHHRITPLISLVLVALGELPQVHLRHLMLAALVVRVDILRVAIIIATAVVVVPLGMLALVALVLAGLLALALALAAAAAVALKTQVAAA